MTYDTARKRTVLFGGQNYGFFSDTWTWDGTNWREEHPATSPPGRSDPAMAFDGATHEVVMFGGFCFGCFYGDTWVWNGTDWRQLFPSSSPSERSDSGTSYDPRARVVVLFGGAGWEGRLNDTWRWNGTTWSQ